MDLNELLAGLRKELGIKPPEVFHNPETSRTVVTIMCPWCTKPTALEMGTDEYQRWREGAFVQDVFAHKSDEWRELLISGSHSGCFDEGAKMEEGEG